MISLHYIQIVALFMAILAGALYLLSRHGRDEVLTMAAKWLLLFALIFGLMPFAWGCSSPTAPSETLRLTFSPAPGCQPGEMPDAPSTYPGVWIQTGADRYTAGWTNGLTVEFRQFGQSFLVCKWSRA